MNHKNLKKNISVKIKIGYLGTDNYKNRRLNLDHVKSVESDENKVKKKEKSCYCCQQKFSSETQADLCNACELGKI